MKYIIYILALLSFTSLSAQVKVGADGAIHATGDYPSAIERELQGYSISVQGIVDRDNIPLNFRDTGMVILVRDSSAFYTLVGDITNDSWVKFSGGSNSDQRLGIGDNLGLQNRYISFQGQYNLGIDSMSHYFFASAIPSQSAYTQILGFPNFISLQAIDDDNSQISTIDVNQDYSQLTSTSSNSSSYIITHPDSIEFKNGNTYSGGIPSKPLIVKLSTHSTTSNHPKFIIDSIENDTVHAPTLVAVWDNDTLKSAKISSFGGGGGTPPIIYAADNGIVLNDTTFELGGSLTGNTTITTGANKLTLSGITGGLGTRTLEVINSSTAGGTAIFGESDASTGMYGATLSGIGVNAQATGGVGLNAVASVGVAIAATSNGSSVAQIGYGGTTNNSPVQLLKLSNNQGSGSALAGEGISISLNARLSNLSSSEIGTIVDKLTTTTAGSQTSEFSITGVGAGTTNTLLTLAGTGAAKFPKYGVGTFSGTVAYAAAFDASGNLIESTSIPVVSATNGDMLYYNSGWQARHIGVDGRALAAFGGVPTYTPGYYADTLVHTMYTSKALNTLSGTVPKISLADTNTAASSADAFHSPAIEFRGTGWATTSGSQQVGYRVYSQTANDNTAQPSAYLSFDAFNGGTYTNVGYFKSGINGGLTITGSGYYVLAPSLKTAASGGQSLDITGKTVTAVGSLHGMFVQGVSTSPTNGFVYQTFTVNPLMSQSAGAGYTGIAINPTETSLGSGPNSFLDCYIGSTHYFNISNRGYTHINGQLEVDSTFTGNAGTDSVLVEHGGVVKKISPTYYGTGSGSGGITTLNTLTGTSQTFATGTSGTDFGISSSGTTHTFNIPTASAANRGLLSTLDWTTFNNKLTTSIVADTILYDTSWFFGNSIEYGQGNYPYLVYGWAHKFSAQTRIYPINRAIQGTTLVSYTAGDSSMQNRIAQLPTNVSTLRNIFLTYGTNDAAQVGFDSATFRQVFINVIDTLLLNRGFNSTPSKIVVFAHLKNRDTVNLKKIDAIYASLAATKGYTYIDMIDSMKARGGYALLEDGSHPNLAGGDAMAAIVENSLSQTVYSYPLVNGSVGVTGNIYVGNNIMGGDKNNSLNLTPTANSGYVTINKKAIIQGNEVLNGSLTGNYSLTTSTNTSDTYTTNLTLTSGAQYNSFRKVNLLNGSTGNSAITINRSIFTNYETSSPAGPFTFTLNSSTYQDSTGGTGVSGNIVGYQAYITGMQTGSKINSYNGFTGSLGANPLLGTITTYNAFSTGVTPSTDTITTYTGFQSNNITATTTNAYAFNGVMSSGTNKYNLYMNGTAVNYLNGALGLGNTSPTARLDLSGNITQAAWTTTSPPAIYERAATYTDNTSSGTVGTMTVINRIGTPTIAASSTTTFSNTANLYIDGAAAAGSNVTLTNAYALYVAAGAVQFQGTLTVMGNTAVVAPFATAVTANNANFQVTGSASATSSTQASLLFGGASTIFSRTDFNGNTSTTLTANTSEANVIVGAAPITTAATGTHAVIANMVVEPMGTITSGGATVTETSQLYINGGGTPAIPTIGANNYALHISGSTSVSAIDGKLIMGAQMRLKGYTVATLPSGTTGDMAYVTDASSPTYGATVAGGGSVVTVVFYNGSNWTCR